MNSIGSDDLNRLKNSSIIWLATTTPDSKPHLVPIWYVLEGDSIWCCTGSSSKKVRNLEQNKYVSISLEDGSKPVIGEGDAEIVREGFPTEIARLFKIKYDWKLDPSSSYDILIRIRIHKWL